MATIGSYLTILRKSREHERIEVITLLSWLMVNLNVNILEKQALFELSLQLA